MVTQYNDKRRWGLKIYEFLKYIRPPTPMSNSHKRLQVQSYITPVILFSSSWIENQLFGETSSAILLRVTNQSAIALSPVVIQ